MSAWAVAAAAALSVFVAGCGSLDNLASGDRVLAAQGGDNDTPTASALEFGEVEDRYNGDGIGGDDEVILAALQDVEAYWDAEFEDVFGDDFAPVDAFYAYGPDTEPPPCGDPPPTYEEIAGNAFFCPGADLIAWDTTELIPDMQEEFGDFALGIVMAHEYGHAIQDRNGLNSDLTITFEQQADCFAGAWAQWVREADPGAQNFELSLDDLDTSLAGFLELRDTLGTSLLDPAAHGTAFDRVSAFQDGFFNGADACAEYADDNLPAVPLEAFDEQFLNREEDADFEVVEDFTVDDLNNFWTVVFDQLGEQWEPPDALAVDPGGDVPECGGDPIDDEIEGEALYCPDEDFVAWDETNLMPELYDEIGDFSMATVIGSQFSLAALEKLDDEAGDLDRALRADCLTGAWIASAIISDRGTADPEENPLGNEFILTPGDLDEVVQAYLTRGDLFSELDNELGEAGTAFVRIGALRKGITTGIEESNSMVAVADCLEEFRTGE